MLQIIFFGKICQAGLFFAGRQATRYKYRLMRNFDSFTIELFARLPDLRYIALYINEELRTASRESLSNSSDSESDKYEELIVNPTLLTLANQRGNIDCGGLSYLIVRYGNFFQFVRPLPTGHVSICIQPEADPVEVGRQAVLLIDQFISA